LLASVPQKPMAYAFSQSFLERHNTAIILRKSGYFFEEGRVGL